MLTGIETTKVRTPRGRELTQGPKTALSFHSSRNTVALGSSTPARVCTALVNRPSGVQGSG